MREDTVIVTDEQPSTIATRNTRALISSVAVSSLGDGVFLAAAPLTAALITRDPIGVAAVAAAEFAPWLLLMPVAGALVDRWQRHRAIMVATDLIRTVVLAVMVVLVATGRASILSLALCAMLIMAAMTFHDTALQTATAHLFNRDPQVLGRVNGRINAATTGAKSLVGPPLGAALFAATAWVPFAVDAVSFAASGLLVATLPKDAKQPGDTARAPLGKSIAEGARWLAHHQQLRRMCIIIAIGNLCYQAALSTVVLYAQEELHLQEVGFGLLLAAGAVGGIIGGLSSGRTMERIGSNWTLLLGQAAQGVAFALLAITSSPWVAGAALALATMGTAWSSVVVISARQELTPAAMLGRVTAAFRTVGTGALPIGAFFGGIVASQFGLRAPLMFAAAALLVTIFWLASRWRAQAYSSA